MTRVELAAFAILYACGGSAPRTAATRADEPQPAATAEPAATVAPEPASAHVRLIHAAVESQDQAVSLVIDEGDSTAPTGYQFSSAYLAVTPGNHAISARANDAELIGASFTLAAGYSTIVAFSAGAFPVALAMAADSIAPPAAGDAQVRFFHAVVGQGAVDVCIAPDSARADGTPVIANVAAGTLGGAEAEYASVPAGAELALQLRAQNRTPCHGRALGVARFTPAPESSYTLLWVGRQARHGVAPELLFCADPPAADTSCATVPVNAH